MAVVRPLLRRFTQSRIRMLTQACGYGLTAADTACSDGADDTDLDYYWGDFKRVCDSNGDGKISRDEFFEFFEKVRKQQLSPTF